MLLWKELEERTMPIRLIAILAAPVGTFAAQAQTMTVSCTLTKAGDDYKGACAIPCSVNNLAIDIGPRLKTVNPIGSGDAMAAGMAAACIRHESMPGILRGWPWPAEPRM